MNDLPEDSARFIAAVVVIVLRGDRLLAMRRAPAKDAAPGAWEALSGRIVAGEQPFEAAVRESREESSLDVDIEPEPIAAYQTQRNDEEMIVVAFRGRSAAGDVILSEEHDAFAWMTLEEFGRVCRFPALIGAARKAMKR